MDKNLESEVRSELIVCDDDELVCDENREHNTATATAKFCDFLLRKYDLLNYEDLPDFMRFNRFIVRGYRPQLPFFETFKSILHFHNESLNVWSHFFGALIFTILMIVAFSSWMMGGSSLDFSVFFSFVFAAQFLLLASSMFHLLQSCAHNANEYSWLARLDYIGISVLIVGSYYAPVYYLFYCQPVVAIYYTGGITLLAGCAITATFIPAFDKPGNEIYRASVFMLMGWFGVACMPHALFLFGLQPLWPLLWRVALLGILYSIGVVFYVSRIPERWYPGKFDFGFNSHVIWHIFVIMAAIATYKLCTYCFDNRFELPCMEVYSVEILS